MASKLKGEELEATIASADVCVLDVRSAKEIAESGTAPGAINVPIDELEERIEEVRTAVGRRSVLTA